MKMRKSEFTCVRDGLVIRGTEFRPKDRKDSETKMFPAVIISHGFMANQDTVAKYAQQFVRWGYAAYTFDFSGGCVSGKSDGKTTEMSVLTEREDLKAVMAYVRSLAYVDASSLVLMGCSQGGFVSALTAARLPEQVAKLILFYPALCIPDDARKGRMMMASFRPDNIPETIKCGPMKLGRIYPASVMKMDPFAEISAYPGPVLIVHGTKDEIVDVSYAQRAQKAWWEAERQALGRQEGAPGSCQLLLLDGAGHGFDQKADREALFAVQSFLTGGREVLTIDVNLTGTSVTRKGICSRVAVTFCGSADSPYFKGTILPGAVDVQNRIGKKTFRFCADYTLEGVDFAGEKCRVHIVNRNRGKEWKPSVSCDSKALGFLNGADCTAYLEMREKGPLVRIYTKTGC